MDISEDHRNRLRLWRRWQITFDWFGYSSKMQRVHQALLVHRQPWTTRALATYTNLPQTTIRRELNLLERGKSVTRTKDGFQITDLAVALALNFDKELSKYVRGGRHLDKKLLDLMKQAPDTSHMNFEMLETHVWWPIIDVPDTGDA